MLKWLHNKYQVSAKPSEGTDELPKSEPASLYHAVFDGFKKLGYVATAKTFDKFKGEYFEVTKAGHFVARLWIDDVMEYTDGAAIVYLIPEEHKDFLDPQAPLVIDLHKQPGFDYAFVDMTNVEAFLKKVIVEMKAAK